MKLEKIRNWIDALRSGKYKQDHGQLCKVTDGGNLFCCLGVACDLENLKYMDAADIRTYLIPNVAHVADRYSATLPIPMRQYYPINVDKCISLMSLNDDYKATFEQIADILENIYFGDCTIAVKILRNLRLETNATRLLEERERFLSDSVAHQEGHAEGT